ncbi:hypothetical protein N7517_000927 [Penicillium concentricum]|uniref:AB hydrolase-1 domain-containing protein n=1 Tax=Penicillium concentricum TaxID=293559 RepID=A0A9W9SR72_9EURO|nr:uncharacterized protein N7517_000927 [Penicillium concentricum]KAJ5383016.1 hypothetical protein N7517_000927 [Penicillium concentricum]
MPSHGQYTTEKITYLSHGETVSGIHFRPTNVTNPPSVVITGPYSFVKEQAPLQYATRLADEGYAALIFDPRTVSESTGQPRRHVSICQGGPESLDVASYDGRSAGVASVSGYYRDHETDIYMICAGCVAWTPGADIAAMKMPTPEQGEALYKARLGRAQKARELYDKTGEVVYQPLVDPKPAGPDTGSLAGLPGPVVWSWYGPWTLKGFENRYAVMSDLDHFRYTTVPGVAKLNKPALIIHGDNCMNAAAAKRHYESIPTSRKKLIWNNEVSHFQHYDQPDCVDRNVGDIAA